MNPKILCIEDDFHTLEQLKRLLEEQGSYDVLTATTVDAAIKAIDSTQDLRLVITDLHLPEKDGLFPRGEAGLELLDYIRSKRRGLPIIIITAYSADAFYKDLLRFGVAAVIPKTAGFAKELLSYIPKAIGESSAQVGRELDDASMLESIRKVLVGEIEKYSSVKERTIHIPQEGYFELIKPLIGFKKEIEKQLARFPFSQNVFLMMKFRSSNRELSDYIIENLSRHGLRGIRADNEEWNITKNVYNPIAALYCCKYGIALFDEPEEHQAYSPNVAYELGMMHYQNKHCLILRHISLPTVPFDLIKDLYETYERDLQVKQIIARWIKQIAINEVAHDT